MRPRLLVLLPRFPYPLDQGDRLRAYYQLRDLSQSFEIHLVCTDREPIDADRRAHVLPFCASIQVIHLPLTRVIWNLTVGFFSGLPFQVAYFRHPKAKAALRQLWSKKVPGLLYAQLVRMGANVPDGLPLYLDFMDAFSAGFQRRAERTRGIVGWLAGWEAKRLKRYEQKMRARAKGCSIISEQDAAALGGKGIDIVPNGVGETYLAKLPAMAPRYDLIFSGNMGYDPNVKAGLILGHEILPKLEGATLCLAGSRPAASLRALESQKLEVTGFVDDLRPYLKSSKLFVAPLFTGQGLQNKLLEAMAVGLPVLTTPQCAAALGAEHQVQLWTASTVEEFVTASQQLLADEALRGRLAAAGRALVAERFSWAGINAQLADRLAALAE